MAAKEKRARGRGKRDRRLRARLARYSAAARGTAAAIGATMLSEAADARIIQHDFGIGGLQPDVWWSNPYGYNQTGGLRLDMNVDGLADVEFDFTHSWRPIASVHGVHGAAGIVAFETVRGRRGDRDQANPAALPAGFYIGPTMTNGHWSEGGGVLFSRQVWGLLGEEAIAGNFVNVYSTITFCIYLPGLGDHCWHQFGVSGKRAGLGIRFKFDELQPDFHYGWIDVDSNLAVYGYAYETEPGVGIAAGLPEPSALALLALGAVGVLARRRRKAERTNAEAVPATV